jgi:RNA-directed DNA polymerase
MALEPEWEAKFEPNSYGFRPGRSCHDAVEAIFDCIRSVPKYVLDADIAKCFDRINHEALLDKLGTFPAMRRATKAWLQAGVMDGEELFPTAEGTPQGGVISPLLANVALHGLATAIEGAFPALKYSSGERRVAWKPMVIRYADDFVVLHRDLEAIEHARQVASEWLKGMGLEMKPSKTRITHTLEATDGNLGFDFLGFHFRQYPRGKYRCAHHTNGKPVGFSPSIRPSPGSQKRFLGTIRDIIRKHKSVHRDGLIALLNPIIRGWGNYFSAVSSSDVFSKMDHLVFQKLWAWAVRRHPNKGRHWIANKYWQHGERRWTFGTVGIITLHKLADISIRRHVKVQGARSPYDGDAIYWSTHMGKHPDLRPWLSRLLKAQQGYCPCCGLFFKPGDLLAYVSLTQGGVGQPSGRPAVVHEHCKGIDMTESVLRQTPRIEEPDEGKLSRPVLKTSASSDARA